MGRDPGARSAAACRALGDNVLAGSRTRKRPSVRLRPFMLASRNLLGPYRHPLAHPPLPFPTPSPPLIPSLSGSFRSGLSVASYVRTAVRATSPLPGHHIYSRYRDVVGRARSRCQARDSDLADRGLVHAVLLAANARRRLIDESLQSACFMCCKCGAIWCANPPSAMLLIG